MNTSERQGLTLRVTREHYDKYAAMAKAARISLLPFAGTGTLGTRERLRALFLKDPNLNNLPLYTFDAYYPWASRVPGGPRSLAENTCLYKHLIVFEVLGVLPVLVETFQETLPDSERIGVFNMCACCDPGCPVHPGVASCERPATTIVYRIDMEDETGTLMCDDCASDALESGVFTTDDDESDDESDDE